MDTLQINKEHLNEIIRKYHKAKNKPRFKSRRYKNICKVNQNNTEKKNTKKFANFSIHPNSHKAHRWGLKVPLRDNPALNKIGQTCTL